MCTVNMLRNEGSWRTFGTHILNMFVNGTDISNMFVNDTHISNMCVNDTHISNMCVIQTIKTIKDFTL